MVLQLAGSALGYDASVVHHYDPVAEVLGSPPCTEEGQTFPVATSNETSSSAQGGAKPLTKPSTWMAMSIDEPRNMFEIGAVLTVLTQESFRPPRGQPDFRLRGGIPMSAPSLQLR